MSLINRMLKDLDAQPAKADIAPIYRPAARRLPGWYWWILLLLPLSLWLWWQPLQQRLHPAASTTKKIQTEPVPATAVISSVVPQATSSASIAVTASTASVAAPVVIAEPIAKAPETKIVKKSVTPQTATGQQKSKNTQKAITKPEQDAAPVEPNPTETAESSEPSAMYGAEPTTEAEPLGEMHVEEQKLSPGEIATLERRKYQQAIARRDNAAAQQALLQVLANDPLDYNSRKQLAALYYGENQLSAARDVLQQGITLMPTNADLRLLAARVAQAMGDKQAALQSLVAISPSVVNNLDFYAMRAALAQQLGQTAEAGYSYLALTRTQPNIGRWWLGLAISQDQRGLLNDAKQAYRRALMDNQLSAASRRFAQQRIQHLEP
ncbi:tetratricopeptide repeat protein [uncultured Tolumonas sp.]|uniref:tetratricopeptide repeat protein n=1 Tax=uncultured Tolumonas sp. TaxID=263765 RepID=UPI00292D688B|nr:hypothetical protein [uncultured Tolumonas sp.]